MPEAVASHQDDGSQVPLPRLLRTKLLVPQTHPEVVPRPRLLSRLDACLQCQLTLISAGAGFGKTTLLSTWIASREVDAAWVALDERDNDPTRFWAYVIAALESRWPDVGQTSLVMLQSPQPPPVEAILTECLNDVAAQTGQCVLILDDYHAIGDDEIHRGVAYLIDHLPPQLRLVLSSRADPPLPLARLRARRQLVELRSSDLRFTPDEASAFLNEIMGLGLAEQDVATLGDLIEGWAAGLQLAALSLQDAADIASFVDSFSGSHRYVFDYLAHEILLRQPEDRQRFLLRTAPLERLSSDLCEAVTGHEDSQAMLEGLDRANLFVIPLDRERRWYRYHHLFADFLRASMHEALAAAEIAELHRRASHWYGERQEYHDAIHHALAAGDVAEAQALIKTAAEEQFVHSQLRTFLDWLDALPSEVVSQDPYLGMAGGWAALALGRNGAAESYVTTVEQRLGVAGSAPDVSSEGRAADGLAEVSVIRASLAFNRMDLDGARRYSLRAREALAQGAGGVFNDSVSLRGIAAFNLALTKEFSGETDAAVRAFEEASELLRQDQNSHVLPMSISHLGQLQMQQGRLRAAATTYQAACESVDLGPARSPLGGLAFTGMGSLLYEWNELDAAEGYLQQGLELGRPWAEWEILMAGYGGLIRVALARGQEDRAREILAICVAEVHQAHAAWTDTLIEGLRVLVALHTDDIATVEAWASGMSQLDSGPVPYLLESQALLLAQVWVALNQRDRAIELLSRLLPAARGGGRHGRVIEARVIEAVARAAEGDRGGAADALTEALQLAGPEGHVRTFLDAGQSLHDLLGELEDLPAYGTQLLAVADGDGHNLPSRHPLSLNETEAPAGGVSADLPEPLSDREHEVLALMAEGLTNQAIADRLYISINTVKTHARHIYEKLDVRNRAQAAHRAAELNLLD